MVACLLSGCKGALPVGVGGGADGGANGSGAGETHLPSEVNAGGTLGTAQAGSSTTGTPNGTANGGANGTANGTAGGTNPNLTGAVGVGVNGGTAGNGSGDNGTSTDGSNSTGSGDAGGGPSFTVNPLTGGIFDSKGHYLRGTLFALPDEPALPASDPNAQITAVDGSQVSYIDAGNSLFVDTKGLTPNGQYTAVLTFPNGSTESQPFAADANGGIKGVSGNFIEFPHVGFHHITVSQNSYAALTGQYKLELKTSSDNLTAQTMYFYVRKRPVVMVTDSHFQEQTVLFSDQPGQLFVHASGFAPGTLISFTVIHANVNRLSPMTNGQDLSNDVFENLGGLRFKADDNGNVHQPLLSWTTRTPVDDDLVVVAKYLNGQSTYVEGEDVAIIDHPTFVIKDSQAYFASVNAGQGNGGVLNGTNIPGDAGSPAPAASP